MADNAKTILVVDDDPDTRTYLTTVLEDNGFATASAKDGTEALTKIGENQPDLIALDIAMPEKSGVAVYRSLKEDEQLKSIPVIIITGISDDFKKFISTRRQVPPPEGYISKPVDFEQLVSMVKDLLG
ncbi:MAG: response regulator [Planctomycetes bacterium]|nr:response regulator [Planctomycetota bacterium]MBL7038137.1 response regulator [Pirellulaceae bacterium]